jgi:hypothetical protein
MQEFKITYHFGKDLNVSRVIKAESKEEAYSAATPREVVQFEEKDVLYSFKESEVKYISVKKHHPVRVSSVRL